MAVMTDADARRNAKRRQDEIALCKIQRRYWPRFAASAIRLTTGLGIAGAFLATWIGQSVGWYRPDQGARFIGAIVGAVILLFVWSRFFAHRMN